MEDHEEIHSKHSLLSKLINCFQLETNRIIKTLFIFQFLVGVGVSVQMFILGPCEIVKLQTFGCSRSDII